jgi:hydrogenase small subunit
MEIQRPSYLQELENKGYSRRDFMKFCTILAAYLGLEASAIGQISTALKTKPRIPVIWLHLQECTGCSMSFIRSSHPIVSDILLDKISLDYSETLLAASGPQAEEVLQQTMEKYWCEYVLCVEGALPLKDDGIYCCVGGHTSKEILRKAADGAKAIIAWGSCASNGGVQSAEPNPTGAVPIDQVLNGTPIIKVPGCPPIAEVMAGVLVHILTFDRFPVLDGYGRPKAFYSKRVHDSCYRRPSYDAGLFVKNFDDENAKKGYCLYKVGCRGPSTYNSCGIIKWNEGTSFPIQSGHGCIGCSEENFWDNGPFYKRQSDISGFGIKSTADKVGMVTAGATAVGLAAHALAVNINKRKSMSGLLEEGEETANDVADIEN